MRESSEPGSTPGTVGADPRQQARLGAFLLALLSVVATFSLAGFVAGFALPHRGLLAFGAVLAGLSLAALIGLRVCALGHLSTAARSVAYSTFIAAAVATYFVPVVSLAAALAPSVGFASVVPYQRGRALRVDLIAAFFSHLLVGAAFAFAPQSDPLPQALGIGLMLSTLAGASFLLLLLSWQFSVRMRLTVDEVLAANAALSTARAAEAYARQQAEAAVQVRDDFLSVASHELRAPLASTAMQLQLFERAAIKESGTLAPSFGKWIERARSANDRVMRLVDTLLDVTRISTGRLELEREQIDLAALAREVGERIRELHPESILSVETPARIELLGDRFRLDQVITNLLSNALKYGDGKPIHVTVSQANGRCLLEVRDQGIGISPERLPHVFERFERAVSSRNYGGFGLGLWIARQIVKAHGGVIRAESTLGVGTTFFVELPRTD